ncbi:MAG: hypothetical protein HQM16_12450 [Deltaproteobacteria bacterium]|nr:hypothetical protein [Deltaproteobacteria bacterium]
MTRIMPFIFLFLCTLALMIPSPAYAGDLFPPEEMSQWLNYALKRFPPTDCPALESQYTQCAAVTDVKLSGDLKSGKINLEMSGYNWSRTEQTIGLLGTSSNFSLVGASVTLGRGDDSQVSGGFFAAPFFTETDGFWKIKIPPGEFHLAGTLEFIPKSVVPLSLAQGIGRVETQALVGGYIQFDENVGNHGGDVQLVLAGNEKKEPERPQVRVTRIFNWGIIPTFQYVFVVSGLTSETPVKIPLLEGEIIEKTEPQRPYTVKDEVGKSFFEATFSPRNNEISVYGHYRAAPSGFKHDSDLPFEIWLHVSDRRYPVTIATDANPVDPKEFEELILVDNARAYMVKPGQGIVFNSVKLSVDEGRKGKGKIRYHFYEGARGFWHEKLFLSAQILGQDRLIIPTPAFPNYAGIGAEGLELFHNEKKELSVRLPQKGLDEQRPIEVAWDETRPVFWFFDIFKARLPGQNVYLEEQESTVYFRPGVIPLFAFGARMTQGDLLDQFHLYGFLIGILAFFICRGLKFGWGLSGTVTLLSVGLYLSDNFPTTALMILLVLTLPLVRLKDDFFEKLKSMNVRRTLVMLVWLIAFVVTVIPLTEYARARVFDALHPYAEGTNFILGQEPLYTQDDDVTRGPEGEYLKKDSAPDYAEDKMAGAVMEEANAPSPDGFELSKSYRPASVQQQQLNNLMSLPKKQVQVNDWNAKPVSLNTYARGGRAVRFTNNNILTGQDQEIKVLLAGPLIRGFWMLLEVVLIFWVMTALTVRTKRLFL